MGRHAAQEPDAVTVELALGGATPDQREIDLGAWWARKTPNARVWLVMGALAGSALSVGTVVQIANTPSAAQIDAQAAKSAEQAGAAYGKELRARGYNSLTVMGRCSVNSDGYGGSHWEEYRDACEGVGAWMQQQGEF